MAKRETPKQVHWYPKESKRELDKAEILLNGHLYIKSMSAYISYLVNKEFENNKLELP